MYIYILLYNNIYYNFICVFFIFLFIGIYLAVLQIELFTAFLWLVECSVLFIFLLLLFFLNVKGVYIYTYIGIHTYVFLLFFLTNIVCINPYSISDASISLGIHLYGFLENYYESLYNTIQNDLFGLAISYYIINGIELLIVGFILLAGSVVCVNLHQMNKNIRVQSYSNFLNTFNFFSDFSGFSFLRKQNLILQGNTKPSLKIFKKK